MAHTELDFSKEDWDTPVEFFDGCWVIAHKHSPGLNEAMELNNRTFVFRLDEAGVGEVLVVFGHADEPAIAAVKKLERDTGLSASWIIGNGGGHHLFLGLWYEAFPEARILVPAKRIPSTQNGKNLKAKYPDRWELLEGPYPAQVKEAFGDQIDLAIFDQLYSYPDEASIASGSAADHTSERTNVGGFRMLKAMGGLMSQMTQPNDEVTLFHKASGLVIAGHNYQISYLPKRYKPEPKFKMKNGGFPMNIMMKMMMPAGSCKSMQEGTPGPIADPAIHAATWEYVLNWPFRAWTTAHDPPGICGPDMDGDSIKAAIRASLERSGETDPTGASLKWTKKHGSHGPKV